MQFNFFDSSLTTQNTTLSEAFPKRMALVDCETTGGKASYHRMIELGIILIDDGEIVEQWQSLINPRTSIPQMITRLTGIEDKDVEEAPYFEEIAFTVQQLLADRVLVAHNARFDLSFVKSELARVDIPYSPKLLCSVKFSRAMYPQFRRHSLEAIIKRFHFPVAARHRAFDDALMIYKLFQKSSELFSDEDIESVVTGLMKTPTLPERVKQKDVKALPQSPGVYYFHDEKGELLYIGKSVNIRSRVMSHFSQDYRNEKDLRINAKLASISFESTPSDFSAQLLESNEIKRLNPLFNKRLKRTRALFQYALTTDKEGLNSVSIEKLPEGLHCALHPYGLFRTPTQAKEKLVQLADEYQLCHTLLGLAKGTKGKPCFRKQLRKCAGACCGEDPIAAHNERLTEALESFRVKIWPWDNAILIEEKSDPKKPQLPADYAYHLVDQWRYLGRLKCAEDLYDMGYTLESLSSDEIPFSENNRVEEAQAPFQFSAAIGSAETNNAELNRFDLDAYRILIRFLLDPEQMKVNRMKVYPLLKAEE